MQSSQEQAQAQYNIAPSSSPDGATIPNLTSNILQDIHKTPSVSESSSTSSSSSTSAPTSQLSNDRNALFLPNKGDTSPEEETYKKERDKERLEVEKIKIENQVVLSCIDALNKVLTNPKKVEALLRADIKALLLRATPEQKKVIDNELESNALYKSSFANINNH